MKGTFCRAVTPVIINTLLAMGEASACAACAGGIYDRAHTATAAKQHSMFEMVYALVEQSILGGDGMKGILFWRWKARDPTIILGAPGEEATLGVRPVCSSPIHSLATDHRKAPLHACMHSQVGYPLPSMTSSHDALHSPFPC